MLFNVRKVDTSRPRSEADKARLAVSLPLAQTGSVGVGLIKNLNSQAHRDKVYDVLVRIWALYARAYTCLVVAAEEGGIKNHQISRRDGMEAAHRRRGGGKAKRR